jgi:hypothetical protein
MMASTTASMTGNKYVQQQANKQAMGGRILLSSKKKVLPFPWQNCSGHTIFFACTLRKT